MLHAKQIEKDSRKNVLYFNPAFFKDLKWIKEYINLNVQFVGKLRINMYAMRFNGKKSGIFVLYPLKIFKSGLIR